MSHALGSFTKIKNINFRFLSLSLSFSPPLATPPHLNSKQIPFSHSPPFNWTGKQDLLWSGRGNYCLLCISTSKCMLAHAFTWSKTIKNIQKSWKKSFFFMSQPYMSLSYARWKRYFFYDFGMFLIIFNHVNACTSMRSLVEVHNNCFKLLK